MKDSEIFGLNQALEKPPRGKPVRERERDFIMLQQKKIRHSYPVQNSTYLNQQTVSFLVHMLPQFLCISFLEKRAKNSSKSQPRFLCRRRNSALDFCAQNSRKICTVRTAINAPYNSKLVPKKLQNAVSISVPKTVQH